MGQLLRDGVALAFEDVGKGAPPIVLVHDFGADRASFVPQIVHFRLRHRVVAVDLRGHGQSAGVQRGCTVAGFADDVAWLCYELGVYQPVVVGHGLGGLIGLELAARYPDLPAAIVVVGGAISLPGETNVSGGGLAEAYSGIPLLHLDDRDEANDFGWLQGLSPGLTADRFEGGRHLPQRPLPDQVSTAIDRFLALLGDRRR